MKYIKTENKYFLIILNWIIRNIIFINLIFVLNDKKRENKLIYFGALTAHQNIFKYLFLYISDATSYNSKSHLKLNFFQVLSISYCCKKPPQFYDTQD